MTSFLSRIFFPERCSGCGKYGSAICAPCMSTIPCAIATDDKRIDGIFDYGHRLVAGAIRNLKYHRRSESARVLTHASTPYILDTIADMLQSMHRETIILVPIPQHKHKRNERGFNQSKLIATWISRSIPDTVVQELLSKSAVTIPQAHIKNKSLRFKNAAYSMIARDKLDPKKLYIVIDDVTTTGATFLEAIRALKASGATKIHCIALAHGYARK